MANGRPKNAAQERRSQARHLELRFTKNEKDNQKSSIESGFDKSELVHQSSGGLRSVCQRNGTQAKFWSNRLVVDTRELGNLTLKN